MSYDLRAHATLPLALCLLLSMVVIGAGLNPPAGMSNYLLEVGPGIAGVLVLVTTYRRFPMSHMVYLCTFLHVLILVYGGCYTYAKTPLGNWFMEQFDLSRNHYDRLGHLALGLLPAAAIREVLLRQTPLRPGGWLNFLIICVTLAIAAFWELLEWWTAIVAAPEVGIAFLGSQGDVWDAQWDIFLALVGVAIALMTLSKVHDRSMAKVPGND